MKSASSIITLVGLFALINLFFGSSFTNTLFKSGVVALVLSTGIIVWLNVYSRIVKPAAEDAKNTVTLTAEVIPNTETASTGYAYSYATTSTTAKRGVKMLTSNSMTTKAKGRAAYTRRNSFQTSGYASNKFRS